ncbi:hypothetical protein AAE478_010250 [Parahypoxylon ruwenzoriense]
MSLRNELRTPLNNITLARSSYNWEQWYAFIKHGSDAIHAANSDVLIFLSGLNSDQDLSPVVNGTALEPGSATFNRGDFSDYADKLVLELHAYDNILGPGPSDCNAVGDKLFNAGFKALTDIAENQFPVILTEFGLVQNGTAAQDPYISCLLDYLPARNAGWMIWQLGGSYYIREGTPDRDEEWGLLVHDWSDWRSPEFVDSSLTPAVKNTFTPHDNPDANRDSSDDESRGTSTKPAMPWFLYGWPLSFYALVFVISLATAFD